MTSSEIATRRYGKWTVLCAVGLIALGVANHLPSLRWGFVYDDYLHQAFIQHTRAHPEDATWKWSLYDFTPSRTADNATLAAGRLPWWTPDDFQIRYFRPITTATLWLDSAFYGENAAGYHVTNLMLFALFLCMAFVLYRAWSLPPGAALWALAFLALDDNHVLPVGWIANRPSLLAGIFICATLVAVHRYRLTRRVLPLVLALLCFAAACLSKETGIIALPIMVLYLLTVDPEATLRNPVRECLRVLRAPALWLFVAVATVGAALYVRAGFGTTSAAHLTPWQDFSAFLSGLALALPQAVLSLFFGVPVDITMARPELAGALAGGGMVAMVALLVMLWRYARPWPVVLLAAGWVLLALVPASVVMASDRAFAVASVGSALLLGLIMHGLGAPLQLRRSHRYGALAIWMLFVITGIVLAVPMCHVRGMLFARLAAADRHAIVNAEIPKGDQAPAAVVVLNTPSSLTAFAMASTWAVTSDQWNTFIFPLQMGRRDILCRRTAVDTLEVEYGSPPLLANRIERLFHTSREGVPGVGTVLGRGLFTATVLDVDQAGIRKVRFLFGLSPEAPGICFLGWERGRLRRVVLPDVGDELILPAPAPLTPYAP